MTRADHKPAPTERRILDTVGNGSTQLLTAEDLSERWKVPKAHVYRLARTGQLRGCAVKLGGRYVRFTREGVEAFEGNGGTSQ